MESELPSAAERYLDRLERALWALPSQEREAILLELRGHLAVRADSADETIAAFGPPERLAREFLAAGAGGGGPAALPEAETPLRLSLHAVLSQVLATWRGSREGLFTIGAVLLTALIASDWALFTLALRPSAALPAWVVAFGRAGAVLLALCAAYRLLLSSRGRAWAVDLSTLRFMGGTLATLVLSAAAAIAVTRAATAGLHAVGVAGDALSGARAALAFLTVAALAVLMLRIQPWLAALAAGRSGLGLRASWRGTRGRMAAIVKGWAVLVLPLYLLHFLLSYAAVKLFPLGVAQLVLAGVDGIVSTVMALAAASLNATVFRWITGDPTPAPRPFGSEQPRADLIEAARLRLSQLVGPPERGIARH
ncbi:MAG TPA: hypothetical protein VE053_05595 [Allosphingosinicella sp.]|nr:hypothetical protein [Allosphingosinicella sp.]